MASSQDKSQNRTNSRLKQDLSLKTVVSECTIKVIKQRQNPTHVILVLSHIRVVMLLHTIEILMSFSCVTGR